MKGTEIDQKFVSIIVPTYKEAQNIPVLVEKIDRNMKKANIRYEIIIIDDDSNDGIIEAVDNLRNDYNIYLKVRKNQRGLSSAVITGFETAKSDIFVVMDADLSHPPEKIPELVERITANNCDFVIGSRFIKEGSAYSFNAYRKLNALLSKVLARPLTRVKDPLSGFFALRRTILVNNLNPLGFKIGLEIIVKCKPKQIVEIPIDFQERLYGKSKLSIKEQLKYLFHISRLYKYKFKTFSEIIKYRISESDKGFWGVFTKYRKILIPTIITAIALSLRIFRLGSQSLWMDEAVTYLQTRTGNVLDTYFSVMRSEGHIGPLYHILNSLFTSTFGYGEWALRMPAAIYGTISVLLVYKIAEELFGRNMSIFSSLLMAFSPVHIWYSQEARMYSLWVMLVLVCTWLFIQIVSRGGVHFWILFTIFASLSIWTFLNSIFVFFAMGLYLFVFLKKYKKELCFYMGCMLIAFISYLPGVIVFFTRGPVAIADKIGSSRDTTLFDLLYAFNVFSVGTSLGPPLDTLRALLKNSSVFDVFNHVLSKYGTSMVPAAVLYGLSFLHGIYVFVTKRKEKDYCLFLFLFFVPIILIFGITLFSKIPFNVRYILCTLPYYLLFLSISVNEATSIKKLLLLLGMILFSTISLYNYYFRSDYQKINFRSIVTCLNEVMSPSDKAIIIHEGGKSLLKYYDESNRLGQYYIPPVQPLEKAAPIIKESDRLFYVKSIRTQSYPQNELQKIQELLLNNFDLVGLIKQTSNYDIGLYKRKIKE